MLNDRDHLRKFSPKADEAKFIGYSLTSKAYRAFLINSKTIGESINVSFHDSFQATSEQLSSGLKLNDIHPTRANEILHLLDELYDDDVPSEDPPRTFEAEGFEEPTGTPLSGPSNTSPSSSVSEPQVEKETTEIISSANEQSPCPEQALEDAAEVPTPERAQEYYNTHSRSTTICSKHQYTYLSRRNFQ